MKRSLAGIVFAVLFGTVSIAIGEARSPAQQGPVRTDCSECHQSVLDQWETSRHSKALDDPLFQETWLERARPGECLSCHTTDYDPESGNWGEDGVTCRSCHTGQTGPHPETAMPTDASSRMCGSCHIDTHDEWQTSAHGEGELACVRCHNPHTTELREGNMQDLCSSCHSEEGYFYGTTAHAQRGLQCTDCHLRVSESPMGDGHGRREHTFAVDLETCNQCHSAEMHLLVVDEDPELSNAASSAYAYPTGESCEYVEPAVRTDPEPATANPLNYLLIAAVGLSFGMAISPMAENWYGLITNRDRGE